MENNGKYLVHDSTGKTVANTGTYQAAKNAAITNRAEWTYVYDTEAHVDVYMVVRDRRVPTLYERQSDGEMRRLTNK